MRKALNKEVGVYSFTIIEAKVKKLKAQGDFFCACCQDEDRKSERAIRKGDDFFWIDGHRSYERIKTVHADHCSNNILVPYVPIGIRKTEKYRRVSPEDFRDLITSRKICSQCFRRFSKFLVCNSDSIVKYEKNYLLKGKYTFRIYNSLREYTCQCCQTKITRGMDYVRKGMHEKFCLDCIKSLEKIIGREFSHY